MGARHVWYRMIATLICMVMFLGMVFQTTVYSSDIEEVAEKAVIEAAVTRATDESTINGWKQYFTNEVDTSNVGKIWTDKTVSDENIILETGDSTGSTVMIEKQGKDNFLVGLSALSSIQFSAEEISIPIDAVFVMDISGSMYDFVYDSQKTSVRIMIEALNETIEAILKSNPQNRVGVILYSGANRGDSPANSAVCPMPLDHYTTEGGIYFEPVLPKEEGESDRQWDWSLLKLSDLLKNSNGEPVGQKEQYLVSGSTYIQNGLLAALETFENRKQDGIERVPVLTLLSDGSPTAVREKYTERGNSTIGQGQKTDLNQVFLTQLTSAWVKARLQEMYARYAPIFYSIGLIDKSNRKEYDFAKMVLAPSTKSDQTLDEYWQTFFAIEPGENMTCVSESNDLLNQNIIVEKADNRIVNRYYIDEYFEPTSQEEIIEAFAGIVEKVQFQLPSYPTNIGEEDSNHSGYLNFHDEIGEYMQVKQIQGVMYDNVLHTGSEFAKKVSHNDGEQEFVQSLAVQLGIQEDAAALLLENARNTGQISFTSDSVFSNYIEWYADAQGNYIAPYIEAGEQPQEAAVINKSYFYSGESSGTLKKTDMMYLRVQIMEDIYTSNQSVRFLVPASLIPIIQYQITKENSQGNQGIVEVKKLSANPVRLFYEVGLRDTINKYDWSEVKDYQFMRQTESLRECMFYTNAWDKEEKSARTTISFEPSEKNEYYYYTKDSMIYEKNETGYVPYIGQYPDSSKTYYYQKIDYIPTENNRYLEVIDYYEIGTEDLKQAVSKEDNWYIPKGTFKRNMANENVIKEKKEGTLPVGADYIIQSKVIIGGNGEMIVQGKLGNNGEYGFRQGKVRIEKQVKNNDYAEGHDDGTQFEFKLMTKEIGTDTQPLKIIEEDNNQFTVREFENGSIQFLLKNHQFKTYWFPLGEQITVEEVGDKSQKYITKLKLTQGKDTVFEQESKDRRAEFIVVSKESNLIFLNERIEQEVDLYLGKVDENGNGLRGAEFELYKCNVKEPYPPDVPYPPDDENDPQYEQQKAEYETALKEYNEKLKQYKMECQKYEEHIQKEHSKILIRENAVDTCWELVARGTSVGTAGKVYFNHPETDEPQLLKKGEYRLMETKAPEGYLKIVGQWNVQVTPEGNVRFKFSEVLGPNGEHPPAIGDMFENMYRIPNYKLLDPPITGGRGTWYYFLFGSFAVLGGTGLVIRQIRRRKHGNS